MHTFAEKEVKEIPSANQLAERNSLSGLGQLA